jgi:glycosyltransferase involved in cell wall biosynthesis
MRFGWRVGGLINNVFNGISTPVQFTDETKNSSPIPFVCVVIPAYQAASTIATAIYSVLDQRDIRVHVVVVDHGSSDATLEVAAAALDGHAATILKLKRHRHEQRSAARPLNAGFHHALHGNLGNFDWVMRLDADDLLASQVSLTGLCRAAKEDSRLRARKLELVCGSLVLFDAELLIAERFGTRVECRGRSTLLAGAAYSIPHHCLLYSPLLLQRVMDRRGHWFDTRISYGEDLDLTLAVIDATTESQTIFIGEDTIYKRLDGPTQTRTLKRIRIGIDHLRDRKSVV